MTVVIWRDGDGEFNVFKDLNALRKKLQEWYNDPEDVVFNIDEESGTIFFVRNGGDEYWTNDFFEVEMFE